MKKKRVITLTLSIIAYLGLGVSNDVDAKTPVVLFFGDSITAYGSWIPSQAEAPFEKALIDTGLGSVRVVADNTLAIGGMTAYMFNHNAAGWVPGQPTLGLLDNLKQRIVSEQADVVVFTLSINDLNISMGWFDFTTYTPEQLESTWANIQVQIQGIVDAIHSVSPNTLVVIMDYDYPNLPQLFQSAGWPADHFHGVTQVQMNQFLGEIGTKKQLVAQGTTNCVYMDNFGMFQYWFGPSPETSPIPGNGPNYSPFMGGDPNMPSPENALRDGLHPTTEALYKVGVRLSRLILQPLFGLSAVQNWGWVVYE